MYCLNDCVVKNHVLRLSVRTALAFIPVACCMICGKPAIATPSATEILGKLSAPMPTAVEAAPNVTDDGKLARGLGVKLRPNPMTHVCEETPNDPGRMSRSLYVEQAPAIDLDIAFDNNSAEIRKEGQRLLDTLAVALRDPALVKATFIVAGHTNRIGDAEHNLRLSCARALANRDYLQHKHGIAPSRILPMGFGFSRPKLSDMPAADENRRVEIRRSSN